MKEPTTMTINFDKPYSLAHLAAECRAIYDRAAADLGPDLRGYSVLDLCADQLPRATLSDLRTAIIVAGINIKGPTMNTYRVVVETRYRTIVKVQAGSASEAARLAWETPDGARTDEESEVIAIFETTKRKA
jgi:hypothetical protein